MSAYPELSITKLCLLVLLWNVAVHLAGLGQAGAATGLPVIEAFGPSSGVIGDTVILLGDNLADTMEVKFNGVVAPFKLDGDITPGRKMILATVPPNTTTGPITVTNPQGSFTTTKPFVVVDGKTVIESFSPTSGPPGTTRFPSLPWRGQV
jgi:hypothetical protein